MDTVVVDPFFADVPRIFGAQCLRRMAEAGEPSLWPAFERGEIDEATLLANFYRQPEAAAQAGLPAPQSLRDAIISRYRFVEGMEQLLSELKSHHRLWILSNYPCWFEALYVQLRLERFFEGVVVSYRSRQRKPEPGAYEALIEASGASPSSVVFIDDRAPNCEAARRAGWRAIHFSSVPALRAAFGAICSTD